MSLTPSGLNPAGFFTIPIKSAPLGPNNELTCVSGCEGIKITVTDSCGCNPVPDADVDVSVSSLADNPNNVTPLNGGGFLCEKPADTSCGDYLQLKTDKNGVVKLHYLPPGIAPEEPATVASATITVKAHKCSNTCPGATAPQVNEPVTIDPHLIYQRTDTMKDLNYLRTLYAGYNAAPSPVNRATFTVIASWTGSFRPLAWTQTGWQTSRPPGFACSSISPRAIATTSTISSSMA